MALSSSKSDLSRVRWTVVFPLLAAVATFCAYWVTLQPGLLGGDSAEAQFAPYTLSIMHVTGYPLYTLLGYIWSHVVVVGDVAYRMNLLSAVAGAVAVSECLWLGHALGRDWVAGAAAALLLACSQQFWDWSTKAGVRSLNITLMLAIFALTIWWGQRQEAQSPSVNRKWVILWFVIGLSLAHHRTTILIMPGVAIYVLWTRPNLLRNWRAILVALVAILPGILTYLYLPLRSVSTPRYQFMPVDSLNHFLDLVLARNMSDMVTSISLQQVPERLGWFIDYLVSQFGAVAILAAFAGMVILLFRHPKEGIMLSSSLLLLAAFTIDYRIEGMAQLNVVFLLPVLPIVSVGVGVLLVSCVEFVPRVVSRVSSRLRQVSQWSAYGLAMVALAAIVLPMVAGSLALIQPAREQPMFAFRDELRSNQATRLTTYPEAFISQKAVIVGEWEQVAAFWYQQLINGRWQNAEFRYPVGNNLGLFIDQAWNQNKEVYLTRAVPGLGSGRYLSMAGPLIHILKEPSHEIPQQMIPVQLTLDTGIEVIGYYPYTDALRSGGVLPVSLFWSANRQLSQDYSVSVRLMDAQGKQVAQEDAEQPVLGSYPTSHWPVAAVIGDYYELKLPAILPAGRYDLALVVYQRRPDQTTQNARNAANGQELNVIGAVQVSAPR